MNKIFDLNNKSIILTGSAGRLGTNFAPQIANVFDKYNRINTTEDQLKIIERQRPIIQ